VVVAAPTPAAGAAASVTIPALTPVVVEVMTDLSSKTSVAGQTFPLRLAVPIIVDGRVLVPAGATGEGEVLNAKHGGMSGSSGVLTLIAHDLKIDGRSLRLRSMHIDQQGDDRTRTAAITTALVGVFGLFVKGGETVVPHGTFAAAKTAEDFIIAAPPVTPAPGDPAPPPATPVPAANGVQP